MAVKQEVYTLETAQSETVKSTDRILEFDLSAELNHGVVVSNLAYAVAAEMGQDEAFCYQMAIAGCFMISVSLNLPDISMDRKETLF